ncbi:tartrate-resistant acid phosphatase type 5-like [Synchiropus splendidus]|uniref:tartrate-resistant acid phosphatase type 5-like n=1 Tax=Synchiropus splendidus TaxID=270530 RepID=UPI00237E2333|nr:tartrate-resistant acid phosphatase type 5-like [Synchiropus splendidus]XP_053711936.1 tartrate-resistant acid phosphatase type 5-like [Synchiropus splendidus]XP_053711937.1 tartrate-resistant acid phosphatase type 5-like [Synchiropus splendidus]XP_053711938.1 tartrate-resistant acid phosphatase type 5-like [Synchiropus splendidus]XP_053711939.1 tartrate-resistant acid phosphatase type 5-like [Synchiropus splendidus]XP_053711940.1 tartrate-resistant acid phosphatase type 5-like [Synchiropus
MELRLVSVLMAAIPVAFCFPTAFQDLEGAAKNRTSIKFLAVGDWGGVPYPPYITAVQKATAREMSRIAAQMGTDFVLSLGDNFYYSGVDSVDSPRFKDTFEMVYTAKSLQVPWYVLAGNHDHAGNVRAQIEYSKKSDRWRFPGYYYELNFRIPSTNKTLTIIMLDTVLLCGNSLDYLDEKPRGPLRAVDANRQLTWLQQRLAQNKADFLLVAGHYPVWSVSEHGPTECLLRRLRPLLLKYKVTAFLCGHDHNLQYIEELDVGYIVSGAGNFLDPDVRHWNRVPKDSVKFFTGQASTLGGFVHAEVTKDKMIVTFLQAKGTSLYRTVLSPRDRDAL